MDFVLSTSADPNKMPHYAAFHLGLHCLSKYQFRDFCLQRVNLIVFLSLNTIFFLVNSVDLDEITCYEKSWH